MKSLFSAFSKAKPSRPEQALDAALWQSPRKIPRRTSLEKQHGDESREFFDRTTWLQPYLNMNSGPRWCFDEKDEADCYLRSIDQPDIGRVFEIWFGSQKVGRLEASKNSNLVDSSQFGLEIAARLHFVESLPFDEVNYIVFQFAISVQDSADYEAAKIKADIDASKCMLRCLWDAYQSPAGAELTCSFNGSGQYFLDYVTHWASNGIDPWRDWSGDRPFREMQA